MYHIKQNGMTVATVDRLQFWRMQRNGIRINCSESEANGIIANDTFYHLPWLPESGGGEEDVTYEEFSGVDTISELDETVIDLEYQNIVLEMGVNEDAV